MPGTLRFVLFGLIALFGIGLSAGTADAATAPTTGTPTVVVTGTSPGAVCGACW
ncbi:hypothetical protein AB0O91_12640 [Kitasatospora sp. NPDC089797]|uniref:hypothetical protein n=1 Tax=Kitasatospora sp. NPDC089797 TaxID=3155298 RepID=UPI003439D0D5